jgi:hypothetical protein
MRCKPTPAVLATEVGDKRNETPNGGKVIARLLSKMKSSSMKWNKVTTYAVLSLKYILLPLNNLIISVADSRISSIMFECLNFNVTHLPHSTAAVSP